jgi:ferredoxin
MSGTLPVGRRDFLFARLRPVITGSTPTSGATPPPAADESGGVAVEVAPPPPWAASRSRARRALPQLDLRAQLDRFACLASVGQVCTVCVERCPEPGAIRLEGLYPIVDDSRCTGCGACEPACPAPTTAIRVLPKLPARPSHPRSMRSS